MSPEFYAIVAVGVSVGGLILNVNARLTARIDRLTARIDRLAAAVRALHERVARIEGALPFLAQPGPGTPPDSRAA